MPINDCYSATIQGRQNGVTCLNTFYWQITAESGNNDDMDSLAKITKDTVVPEIAKWTAEDYVFENAIVRRLEPALTDVFVLGIGTPGDLVSNPLPTTCFMLIRYYSKPYQKGTSFHWKFAGMPQDGHNRGRITDSQIVRASDFIQLLTLGPLNLAGNFFQLINSRDAAFGGGQVLPVVNKMSVDTELRNLIGRQSRPLG
mgnify:CR=1 FL=1